MTTRIIAGAFIDYRNGRWRYERRQENRTEWRNVLTFEHILLTDRELQVAINREGLRLFNGDGKVPVDGQTSAVFGRRGPSKADWEEAGRKLLFVQAIHDAGLFKTGTSVADWQEVIDHVFQTAGQGWKVLRRRNKGSSAKSPCYRSVRNWVIDGGKKPTLEKMLPRHRHKGNYADRIHTDLRKLITEHVDERYLQRPAITLDALKTIIHTELKKLNEKRKASGLDPFDPPGVTAIQSSIDSWPMDEVLRRRYGDMAAFLVYGSAEAQEDPEAPLDRVELDATPCDLFVVDPETGLPIGRPHLVVVIDRCSRMVLGWFVTFEKPSILALMQCLRNAILQKDYVAEMREKHGWAIANDPETYGVPRCLRVDRGIENLSEHVARFAVRVGINRIEITGGKKPWLKGAVERVIKTISERLFHPTKGTTFHNTLMRMGYDAEKDAVCTPDDLDYALHKFFIDIYPFEKRRSLNNRQAIKVWRAGIKKHPIDSIGSIADVAHLFGRTESAKPARHGLNYESMQYFSTQLLEEQRSSQFQKALKEQGGKIEFHVDPADLGRIHVRLPHKEGPDSVIVVPIASKWTRYATGLSIWHHRRIREFAGEEARGDADALLQAKFDLMEIMKGSGVKRRGGTRARSLHARMEGQLRLARAGDDASTTVPGSDAHPDQVVTPAETPMQEEAPPPADSALDDDHSRAVEAPDATDAPDVCDAPDAAEAANDAQMGVVDIADQQDETGESPVARRPRRGFRP